MIIKILSFIQLIKWIILLHIPLLNQPRVSRINLHESWCIILFIHCWNSSSSNVLLRILYPRLTIWLHGSCHILFNSFLKDICECSVIHFLNLWKNSLVLLFRPEVLFEKRFLNNIVMVFNSLLLFIMDSYMFLGMGPFHLNFQIYILNLKRFLV